MKKRNTHIIDATDRSLGRLAVEAAILLRGKHKENFVPNEDVGDFVTIKNFSKVRLSGKKMEQKKYYRHSGYLGGLKELPLSKLYEKDPARVMVKAVWGMLPKNKLRKEQIKRLKIEM